MNNVNANTNTEKEEIKYLTLDDIDKMYEEAEPADWGYLGGNGFKYFDDISGSRYVYIREWINATKAKVERLPADHSKFLLDFYNLFDENEPYKDKEGRPYRDNLLNDLYHNIYSEYAVNFASDNGKEIYEHDINRTTTKVVHTGKTSIRVNVTNKVGTKKIPVLDKNQKIEKLKKSFDIFKRLKERDLVLASMYASICECYRGDASYLVYHDYLGDEDTLGMLLNEGRLLDYIRCFFAKANPRAFLFIRDNFPNVKVTENMMTQYLEYKGR